jgi:hypothetical protein
MEKKTKKLKIVRGRPVLPPGEKRKERYTLKLTDAEHAECQRLSQEGVAIVPLARDLLLAEVRRRLKSLDA